MTTFNGNDGVDADTCKVSKFTLSNPESLPAVSNLYSNRFHKIPMRWYFYTKLANCLDKNKTIRSAL